MDKNEAPSMMVYPSRNMLVTELFISDALKYCDGKPKFAVDGAPWLTKAFEGLGLQYNVESFR